MITITLPISGIQCYVVRIGISEMRIMDHGWKEIQTETIPTEDLAYALECVLEYESRFININKGSRRWN